MAVRWAAEHRKQYSRAVLFHLDRRKERVESAHLEQAGLDGSQYFRREVIDIRLELHNAVAGFGFFRLAQNGSQKIRPIEQFTLPEAIADLCRAHFGHGSDNMVKFRDNC